MLKPNLNFLLFSSTGLGFVISALLLLICTQMQAGAGTKMVSVSQISCWYLVPGTRNLVSKCQAPAIFRSAAWHIMGSWVPCALWHLGLGNVQEVFRERYQIISTIHDKFSNDRDCIQGKLVPDYDKAKVFKAYLGAQTTRSHHGIKCPLKCDTFMKSFVGFCWYNDESFFSNWAGLDDAF